MIEREITPVLVRRFKEYPVVTVMGPRQSGKTTLCRTAFPSLKYVNLEVPDQREFAESDPRGFLMPLAGGAILDEIQRVPTLLSYLQALVDELRRNSLFVLTGSEQFAVSDAIDQSLAGRAALLRLLPFTLGERRRAGASGAIDDILYSGCYPRIHDQRLEPREALRDYLETYVERDVRQIGTIRNLSSFRRFVRLCAGRVGQLVNLTSLGADAGISHTTARQWMTILEASYVVFQLPPFHANLRKRLVKSPKLYFHDVGLASHLVGIERPRQLATHPLRGPLFENAAVVEALKHRFNRGQPSNLSFFRDSRGLECDLVCEYGQDLGLIEIKSGATIASDSFRALEQVAALLPQVKRKAVLHGGGQRQARRGVEVAPLAGMSGVLEGFESGTTPTAPPPPEVRWLVHFRHPEGSDREEPDFPAVSLWHPDEETARKEAARVLVELAEARNDRRDWTAAGHPDPFAVASGQHPGGPWLLRYRDPAPHARRRMTSGAGQSPASAARRTSSKSRSSTFRKLRSMNRPMTSENALAKRVRGRPVNSIATRVPAPSGSKENAVR